MKSISFVAIIVIILTAAVSSCGNRKRDKDVIRIAYLPITHALPLIEAAKDKEVNIELVKYGSWPELLDALNTGRVDGASVLIELAMKSKENGIGLTAVALGHRDGNIVVVSNGIHRAEDLRGKSFAIPHRSSSHYILLRDLLLKNHLKLSDVNIVELAPSEMPSALASNRISGYCVAEPFGSIGVASGKGHVLYQSNQLWKNSICCGLVLNDDFIKTYQALAERFVQVYEKAGKRLKDHQLALHDLKSIIQQDDHVLEQSLRWIDYSDLSISKSAYNDLISKIKAYDIAKTPPSYEQFVKQNLK